MSETSTLISCTGKITREELAKLPTPPATETHIPIAFVQIDPHQKKLIRELWPNEYDRPVYFVELRDNCYACSWCELEDSFLLLIPSPRSPVSIRRLRYQRDAEITGRVVGFAQRLADIRR